MVALIQRPDLTSQRTHIRISQLRLQCLETEACVLSESLFDAIHATMRRGNSMQLQQLLVLLLVGEAMMQSDRSAAVSTKKLSPHCHAREQGPAVRAQTAPHACCPSLGQSQYCWTSQRSYTGCHSQ